MNPNDLESTDVPQAEPCAPWRQWGSGLEPEAVKQVAKAWPLPIAIAGALMPDAHIGYRLPIGGVLATENSVIPYGVGFNIACRMKNDCVRPAGKDDRWTEGSYRQHHRERDAFWNRSEFQAAP